MAGRKATRTRAANFDALQKHHGVDWQYTNRSFDDINNYNPTCSLVKASDDNCWPESAKEAGKIWTTIGKIYHGHPGQSVGLRKNIGLGAFTAYIVSKQIFVQNKASNIDLQKFSKFSHMYVP